MESIRSVEVVKAEVDAKLKAKESVAGIQFVNAKGSIGTIMEALSARGKLQASMTCVEGGPDHIRERSDWHQCYLSPEKAKNKPRKTGGPNTGMSLRTPDGTLLSFKAVVEGDSDEVKAAKELNNEAFAAAKTARDAAEASEKTNKAALRAQKQEEARVARKALKDAETAKAFKDSATKLKEYAESIGAKVSPNAQTEATEPTDETVQA